MEHLTNSGIILAQGSWQLTFSVWPQCQYVYVLLRRALSSFLNKRLTLSFCKGLCKWYSGPCPRPHKCTGLLCRKESAISVPFMWCQEGTPLKSSAFKGQVADATRCTDDKKASLELLFGHNWKARWLPEGGFPGGAWSCTGSPLRPWFTQKASRQKGQTINQAKQAWKQYAWTEWQYFLFK